MKRETVWSSRAWAFWSRGFPNYVARVRLFVSGILLQELSLSLRTSIVPFVGSIQTQSFILLTFSAARRTVGTIRPNIPTTWYWLTRSRCLHPVQYFGARHAQPSLVNSKSNRPLNTGRLRHHVPYSSAYPPKSRAALVSRSAKESEIRSVAGACLEREFQYWVPKRMSNIVR